MNRRAFLKSNAAALALPGAVPFLTAFENPAKPMFQRLLFGADYYPDQTDGSLWAEDAQTMSQFGLTNVRIAEFAWGLMEPSEGRFEFGWLHRAVDLLHGHKLAVILGTPSAAPPPWLTQKYPEVFEVNEKGVKLSPEGRRFTCPTNKTYRRLALSIATEMTKSFAKTPGVVGWQIDNELTLGSSPRCYCKFCRAGFQDWLRAKYKTLDALNKAWGTVFWSQTYTDFSQIPVPLPSGAPPNPGLALDYDRYQSYANVSFLEEQLAMLRKTCPAHFITTNNVALADTIDMRRLFANLDFASGDNYPGYLAAHAAVAGRNAASDQIAPVVSFSHDFMRGTKQGRPFLIMEEQVGKAGQPTFCPQPEKGQLRLWSYQAIAHGAMGINYFRWDTATFGAEEYWHGLLNHDRSKSPGYDEIRQTVRELKALGHDTLNAPYATETALCFDYNSDWAFAIQPGQPKLKYSSEVIAWYGSLWANQIAADIVDATGDLSTYKVLFAPAQYVVSEKQASNIRNFVRAGGTFVTGFRLGVKEPSNQIVKMPLPGRLRDVMGISVEDYVPMYWQKQGMKFSSALAGPDAECQIWFDVLTPAAAEVLATYTMGDHAGKAAITSNSFGKGKAIYIGAKLDQASLGRVLHDIAATAGVRPEIEAPQGIEVTSRGTKQRRWIFLLNHLPKPETVTLARSYKDALTGKRVAGAIHLEAYDARVLQIA